ncbi:hypothetical protein R1flu_020253 [Riccia fluitans]|uniref:Uncharacterized protein n=1 Tax=Riccia fluitans TaxID=41844 RepID=A0ABD1ZKZ1_9MARC
MRNRTKCGGDIRRAWASTGGSYCTRKLHTRLVEMNFRLHDQTLLHVSNWRARDGRDPRTGSFVWSNFKANVMAKKPKQEAQEMKQQKLPRRSLFGYL